MLRVLISFIILISYGHNSLAYVYSVDSEGKRNFWPKGSPINIYVNPSNDLGVSEDDFMAIVGASSSEWNDQINLSMKYHGGSSVTGVQDGVSSISFSGNTAYLGSSVLAVTISSYTDQGKLAEGDIIINDNGLVDISLMPASKSYLGGILSHELGHFLGLGHSEVLDATMFYSTFYNQSSLSEDDIAGARTLYPRAQYGQIVGRIEGGDGVGIFGAHVQAISLKTGRVAAAIISNQDGSFTIGGLDLDDSYYLYVSPLVFLSSLPIFYSSVKNDFCPNRYSGSFFSGCNSQLKGRPYLLDFANSTSINAGVVSISCDEKVGPYYLQDKLEGIEDKGLLWSANAFDGGSSFTGFFFEGELGTSFASTNASDLFTIDLSGFEHIDCGDDLSDCYLKIHVNSLDLASPMSLRLEVQESGSTASGEFISHNEALDLDMNQTLSLSIKGIKDDLFHKIPSRSKFRGDKALYLLSLSIRRNLDDYIVGRKSTLFRDNASCLEGPYSYSVASNPSSVEGFFSSDQSEGKGVGAACGTIDPSSGGPGAGRSSFLFIFTFFLLYLGLIHKSYNKSLSKE